MHNETLPSRSYPQNWVGPLLLSLNPWTTATGTPENLLESTLKTITGYVASGVKTAAPNAAELLS